LESINKSGFASRSEGTDAARSVMAECVMINKGTHLIEVLESLKNILGRSGGHRAKKRYLFRPLAIAHRFLNNK
jgi:pyruvate kinase